MKNIYNKIYQILFILINFLFFALNPAYANESYFDLSEKNIEIQTNFNGKEIIIFGVNDPENEIILTIKGPKNNTKVNRKEKLFGLWFDTKRIIYKDLPNIFFIASTSEVNKILDESTITKKALSFDKMINNLILQSNFIFSKENNLKLWNESLIKIKKESNLYKEHKLEIIDDKLFQTKVFFPSNTLPGLYDVTIYQIKNKIVIGEKNKKITVSRAGIGSTIYEFAHGEPATYGIICIMLAAFAGLAAATAFRKL